MQIFRLSAVWAHAQTEYSRDQRQASKGANHWLLFAYNGKFLRLFSLSADDRKVSIRFHHSSKHNFVETINFSFAVCADADNSTTIFLQVWAKYKKLVCRHSESKEIRTKPRIFRRSSKTYDSWDAKVGDMVLGGVESADENEWSFLIFVLFTLRNPSVLEGTGTSSGIFTLGFWLSFL